MGTCPFVRINFSWVLENQGRGTGYIVSFRHRADKAVPKE